MRIKFTTNCFFLCLILCVGVLGLLSCEDAKTKTLSDKLSLVENGYVSFPLDTNSSYTFNIKKRQINDQVFLSFFNPHNYTIYIYNYHTQKLVQKIPLEREGPHGIDIGSNLVPGYFIHRLDSVFLSGFKYHYLIDGSGKIRVKGQFGDHNDNRISVDNDILSIDNASYYKNGALYAGITSYATTNESPFLQAKLPSTLDTILTRFVKEDELIDDYDEVIRLKALLKSENRYVVMGLSFYREDTWLYASSVVSDSVSVYHEDTLAKKIYLGDKRFAVADSQGYFDKFRTSTYKEAQGYANYGSLFTLETTHNKFILRLILKGDTHVFNEEMQQEEQVSKGMGLIVKDMQGDELVAFDIPNEESLMQYGSFLVDNKLHFKLENQPNENEVRYKIFTLEIQE